MAAEFISQLPIIAAHDLEADLQDCPICHEPYTASNELAVRTQCNHILGSSCLESWLAIGKATCPYCRQKLWKGESSETSNDESDDEDIYSDEFQDSVSYYRFGRHMRAIILIISTRGDNVGMEQWIAWIMRMNAYVFSPVPEYEWRAAYEAMLRLWGSAHSEHTNREWLERVAVARHTRRAREFRLYLKLRALEIEDVGDVSLKEWDPAPRAQDGLTLAQGEYVLGRMVAKGAFELAPDGGEGTVLQIREQWERIRDAGYVYDSDKVSEEGEILGRWSLAAY